MRVSTFGAWNNEVQQLISDLCSKTNLQEKALSEWFYDNGMDIFESSQRKYYQKFIENNPSQKITFDYMKKQREHGFNTIFSEFLLKFVNSHNGETIQKCFDTFLTACLADNHMPFIAASAEVTNAMQDFQKQNPDKAADKHVLLGIVIDKFQEIAHKNPMNNDLVADINAHITLLNEKKFFASRNPGSPFLYKQPQDSSTTTTHTVIETPKQGMH